MLSRKRNRPGRRAAPASRSHDVSHVAQTHCPSAAKRSVAVCRSGNCALRIVRCTRLSVPRCLLTAVARSVARSVARMGSCCSAPIGTAGCWHTTPCFYNKAINDAEDKRCIDHRFAPPGSASTPRAAQLRALEPRASPLQAAPNVRQLLCAYCCGPIAVQTGPVFHVLCACCLRY